jgi:hypothetical protein
MLVGNTSVAVYQAGVLSNSYTLVGFYRIPKCSSRHVKHKALRARRLKLHAIVGIPVVEQPPPPTADNPTCHIVCL